MVFERDFRRPRFARAVDAGPGRCHIGGVRTALALAVALAAAGALWAAPQECPVHGVALRPAKLSILYGMPSPSEFEEMDAAKKLFPFGRDRVLGGCIVRREKTVDGFLCPECVKARAAWLKKHGG